jgi:acetyl-CoA acetyltransferase
MREVVSVGAARTLLHILKDSGDRCGCAGVCLGGGEALAVVVENLA